MKASQKIALEMSAKKETLNSPLIKWLFPALTPR